MMAEQTEIAVIGAGLMGAAAAWRLAGQGRRVTLFEQFDLSHARGSSHGAARIFRLAYDEPDYVELARMALPLWREVERELGEELLWTTGGIDGGPPQHLASLVASLERCDVPFDRLTSRALEDRYPAFRLPPNWEVIFQAEGGVLFADRCRLGLLELAARRGALLHENTRVTTLEPERDSVTLQTTRGPVRADMVVVTAAGWSNGLLAPLGLEIPLRITREHVAFYPLQQPVIPFIMHMRGDGFDIYGLPDWHEQRVKVGEHGAGPAIAPDDDGGVEPARIAPLSEFVRSFLSGAAPDPIETDTCLYASTPDDDFVLDRVGPIVLGFGFGGHGFKFGALIGTLLANLVDGEPIPAPARFARRRFDPTPA